MKGKINNSDIKSLKKIKLNSHRKKKKFSKRNRTKKASKKTFISVVKKYTCKFIILLFLLLLFKTIKYSKVNQIFEKLNNFFFLKKIRMN